MPSPTFYIHNAFPAKFSDPLRRLAEQAVNDDGTIDPPLPIHHENLPPSQIRFKDEASLGVVAPIPAVLLRNANRLVPHIRRRDAENFVECSLATYEPQYLRILTLQDFRKQFGDWDEIKNATEGFVVAGIVQSLDWSFSLAQKIACGSQDIETLYAIAKAVERNRLVFRIC